jgi:hypothetical protein
MEIKVIVLPVGNGRFPALQRRSHDSHASRDDIRESLAKALKGEITKPSMKLVEAVWRIIVSLGKC